MKKKIKENLLKDVEFEKSDGLSFLNKVKTESGNIITASINYSLIGNSEYLKRIAQEIYRVTPKDGVYISTDSDEIEEEATKVFSTVINIGPTHFFFKQKVDNSAEKMEQKTRLIDLLRKKELEYGLDYEPVDFIYGSTLEGIVKVFDTEDSMERSRDINEKRKFLKTQVAMYKGFNENKNYDAKKRKKAETVYLVLKVVVDFLEKDVLGINGD